MGNSNMKNYQFIIGLVLVLIGILIFSFMQDPLRYFGFIFIFGAAIYYITISVSKAPRSKTFRRFNRRSREELLRHQHHTK